MSQFALRGHPVEEINTLCGELISEKTAVEIDRRLIALAVRAPVPELPTAVEYPGGVVIHKEYAHLVKQAAR